MNHIRFSLSFKKKPRLCLVGDHSNYHGGCAAVIRTLRRLANEKGWQVVGPKQPYDALIVNGEGSMHHGSAIFHKKMTILRNAVDKRIPAILVNSVWQDNPHDYDEILKELKLIVVREVLSQHDLSINHGVNSKVFPDLSFFDNIFWSLRKNLNGKPGITDFFIPSKSVRPSTVMRGKNVFERLDNSFNEACFLDLENWSWYKMVNSLKTARYLITGRHHAVYAACAAGIPFLASEGNSHKIRGLVVSASSNIIIADSPAEIESTMAANLSNLSEYQRLLDWLRSHKTKNLIPSPDILL